MPVSDRGVRRRRWPSRACRRTSLELLTYLFTEVLDGRNAHLADGVQRALGREPRDFGDYARAAAATGVWAG